MRSSRNVEVRVQLTRPYHAESLGPVTFCIESGDANIQTYLTWEELVVLQNEIGALHPVSHRIAEVVQ